MITRAQAEALLTLAESLEACERLGVSASVKVPSEQFGVKGIDYVSAIGLRLMISALIPKSET